MPLRAACSAALLRSWSLLLLQSWPVSSEHGKGTKAALLLAECAVQMLEIQPALTYQVGGRLLRLLIVKYLPCRLRRRV